MYALYAFLLSILLCLPIFEAEGATREYNWEVKYEYKSPDCFKKLAITINGEAPGPTINVTQGDTVIVKVTNSLLTEGLTIHWHGLRQKGKPWFDGTEAVSQCPIVPGDTFTYELVVDRAGTYLYHAHYGMQREAGLNGMIIVNLPQGQSEPFEYDYDRSMLLTDWYHKNTYEAATGLLSNPFTWVGEPQSLLIQGRGSYDCEAVPKNADGSLSHKCSKSNPECSPFSLTVESGKTYRLRIGSLTSLSALSFAIEGHGMIVVEADGDYVEPFPVENLFIYSGETYSVLLTANQSAANYWIKTSVVSREPKTPTGLAILNYTPQPVQRPSTDPTPGPKWDNDELRIAQSHKIYARQGHIETPATNPNLNRTIILLNTQTEINGYKKWTLNNVSLTFPTTPYLVALKDPRLADKLPDIFDQTEPPADYDRKSSNTEKVPGYTSAVQSSGIHRLKKGQVVDVVLQNAVTSTEGKSETHPWHLHGHDFWVLGYGTGKFDPKRDPNNYNLVNPIMKNTVPLHPQGWTALRFIADNPGVWLFHCHIDSHFLMGMGVVFEVEAHTVGDLPSSIMGCGMTKDFYVNQQDSTTKP